MENLNIYENISERTQGNIYIGVVGPVRTGKSTFIKRFMDLLVVPNIENTYVRERVKDELPQSGGGKTIMTTEPKFVPAEAVKLDLAGDVSCQVRLIDCVGYMVDGALGHSEEGVPRMVSTPWAAEAIPFEEAAEIGTRKVIADHSTIGLVITTDGSISEIPRENYKKAEARVIRELKELNKPFLVIMNSILPDSERAIECKKELEEEYGVPVMAVNCAKMSLDVLNSLLEAVLYEFPVSSVTFTLPGFVGGLDKEHWIKAHISSAVREWGQNISNIRDIQDRVRELEDGTVVRRSSVEEIMLGDGRAAIDMDLVNGLFYKVLSDIIDYDVRNDRDFFEVMREISADKREYDKMKTAMMQVESMGYGIVQPRLDEMTLEEPEIFKQGSKYGVRIKANAPSLHMIKVGLTTEVAPIIGTEAQSQDLIDQLMANYENEPEKVWETNLFGKTLYETVAEQIKAKSGNVPDNLRFKVQKSVQKIADDGKEYFICIII
ncbi:MAG: stage IV sporulation protein A [Clostridiales bacterium]|nr:stage IV sporulation protein A [Clostridiales bacterium]